MRLTLVRLDALTHHFIWSHHHLLLDGWSVPLLLKEVFTAYEAARLNQPLSLPVPRPYRDYILWLKQQDLGQAEQYWRKTLRGFSAPIRLDVRRPTAATSEPGADGPYLEAQVRLSREATEQLQQYGRREQVTMNTLVQGAWALLLSRYSGQQDVVFGATVSGRPAELAGAEQMVGLFINTLPVRVQVNGEECVSEWLRGLQRGQVEARQYEYSPLAEVQRWSEVERGVGLFETLVVFENFPIDESLRQQSNGLVVRNAHIVERTNYPLTVVAVPDKELSLFIAYSSSQYNHATITRMLGHFTTLLEGIAQDRQLKLSDIPLLTEAEQQQLVEWNDTTLEHTLDKCIHHLFEAQVKRTPEAVAAIIEDEQVSYTELNARANQLASHLLGLSVGPEVRVGISTKASVTWRASLALAA
jgi:non-ribosomal peptide synthetase component F